VFEGQAPTRLEKQSAIRPPDLAPESFSGPTTVNEAKCSNMRLSTCREASRSAVLTSTHHLARGWPLARGV